MCAIPVFPSKALILTLLAFSGQAVVCLPGMGAIAAGRGGSGGGTSDAAAC